MLSFKKKETQHPIWLVADSPFVIEMWGDVFGESICQKEIQKGDNLVITEYDKKKGNVISMVVNGKDITKYPINTSLQYIEACCHKEEI